MTHSMLPDPCCSERAKEGVWIKSLLVVLRSCRLSFILFHQLLCRLIMRRCLSRCAESIATHAHAAASSAAAVAPLRPHQFRVIVREMRDDELPEFVRPRISPAATAAASGQPVRLQKQSSRIEAAESERAQVKAIEANTTANAAAPSAAAPAFVLATPASAVRHSADRFRSFQSVLHVQEQRSPVSLPHVPVVASTAAAPAEPSVRETLRSSVRRLLGMDVITAAVRVVSKLQLHCDHRAFRSQLGFTTHPLSVIELRALHLWLLHVRLRDEPAPSSAASGSSSSAADDASSVIPASYVESLFKVFWDRQVLLFGQDIAPTRMREMQEYAYGAFHALDHSLLALLRAQAEAEQTGSVAGSGSHKLKSAEFQPGLSMHDLSQGADVLLLSSLWKNTLLGDRRLHPLVVASLLRYVSATLARLYATPADLVWKGKFEWIEPETSSSNDAEAMDEQQKQAYFDMLLSQANPVAALQASAAAPAVPAAS